MSQDVVLSATWSILVISLVVGIPSFLFMTFTWVCRGKSLSVDVSFGPVQMWLTRDHEIAHNLLKIDDNNAKFLKHHNMKQSCVIKGKSCNIKKKNITATLNLYIRSKTGSS